MPIDSRATRVYTIKVANIIRTQFFFWFLKKAFKNLRKKRAVENARQEFFRSGLAYANLKHLFGPESVNAAMTESHTKCLELAKNNCREDEGLDICALCTERKVDTYLIHGSKAHKCVCAVCAMTIALQLSKQKGKVAECPFCREPISLIVDMAPLAWECVCGQESCGRHLIVSQKNDGEQRNQMDAMRSFCECHTCTLETMIVSRCSVVYELYT